MGRRPVTECLEQEPESIARFVVTDPERPVQFGLEFTDLVDTAVVLGY